MTRCTLTIDPAAAAMRAEALDFARSGPADRLRGALRRAARAPKWPVAIAFIALALALVPASAAGITVPDAPEVPSNILDFPAFVVEWLNYTLVYGLLGNFICGIINYCIELIASSSGVSYLTSTFGQLLGSNGDIQRIVGGVADVVVKPCALTILAMATLVNFISIARRMDQQGGTMPAFRELLMLFVYFVFFTYFVTHAEDVMQGVYELIRLIILGIEDFTLQGTEGIGQLDWVLPEGLTVADMALLLFCCIFLGIATILQIVAGFVAGVGRAIEIYVLTMLSPLPFAFMGFEGTRQWGIGYIKEFISVCLAGGIIIFIQMLAPYLMRNFVGDISIMDTTSIGDALTYILLWAARFIAVQGILILTMMRSGQLAKNVLGG